MLKEARTNKFKKDWKRLKKSGYNLSKVDEVMQMLRKEEVPLPEKYLDHPLEGEMADFRECHIKFDWLLIYYYAVLEENDSDRTYIDENGEEQEYNGVVVFVATGNHDDLF